VRTCFGVSLMPTTLLNLEVAPRPEDLRVIREGLRASTDSYAGPVNARPFAIFVRDNDGNVVGGLEAERTRNRCEFRNRVSLFALHPIHRRVGKYRSATHGCLRRGNRRYEQERLLEGPSRAPVSSGVFAGTRRPLRRPPRRDPRHPRRTRSSEGHSPPLLRR
jgi:hypothetical protein